MVPQFVSKPALISTCFFKYEEIPSNMWFSPSAGMSNFECWNSKWEVHPFISKKFVLATKDAI